MRRKFRCIFNENGKWKLTESGEWGLMVVKIFSFVEDEAGSKKHYSIFWI